MTREGFRHARRRYGIPVLLMVVGPSLGAGGAYGANRIMQSTENEKAIAVHEVRIAAINGRLDILEASNRETQVRIERLEREIVDRLARIETQLGGR